MQKTHNYVYIVTNLTDDKQYVGDHSTNNIDDGYLGSGLYLKRAIKKHGKENFKKEILEFFPIKKNSFDNQEKFIIKYNTLSPNGYNISPKGGLGVNKCHSEETMQKLRNHKSKEHKQNISYSKQGEKNPMYGKHMTEKTKQQIIKSNMLRVGEKNPMYGKHRSEEIKEKLKIINTGKKLSDEHKRHISESHEGKFYITNEIITKQLKKDNNIPEGWKLGRKKNNKTPL